MIDISSFVAHLSGKPVAVFGLARTGLSVLRALQRAGVEAYAWDDNTDARDKAAALGARVEPLSEEVLRGCACLVLAPGVPLNYPKPHPVVVAARAAGVEILCDVEIFGRCVRDRKMVGITGTNGKSTTTALVAHILRECGVSVACGGNIGVPVFDLEMPEEGGVFVFELSSYQLDLCPSLTVDIAVLLNITPDHLDRHGSMAAYEAAKRHIFKNGDQVKIDCPAIDERVRACTNMRGDHNLQNATAALLVCEALGLREAEILAAIKTFPGLAHRQFLVRKIDHVSYVNDSKATNAEAAGKALGAYRDIYWIAGGQAKEGGLSGLEPFMPRVRHAFLIGEAADEFAAWLAAQGVAYTKCGTLERAVEEAHKAAQNAGSGVVLLSPACASWDQFTSFEHRGEVFTQLVEGLDA